MSVTCAIAVLYRHATSTSSVFFKTYLLECIHWYSPGLSPFPHLPPITTLLLFFSRNFLSLSLAQSQTVEWFKRRFYLAAFIISPHGCNVVFKLYTNIISQSKCYQAAIDIVNDTLQFMAFCMHIKFNSVDVSTHDCQSNNICYIRCQY